MPFTPEMRAEIDRRLRDPANADLLAAWLIANSNLPGPRANLELIYGFAKGSRGHGDWLPIFETWLAMGTPPGDPAEAAPFRNKSYFVRDIRKAQCPLPPSRA